jgi:hypothetical protein
MVKSTTETASVVVKENSTVTLITSFGRYIAYITRAECRANILRKAFYSGAWAYFPKKEGQASTRLTFIRADAILGVEFDETN